MVVTLQSFDVTDAGSIELANTYMTRYTARMDSTAQDSAWLGYLDFLSRFMDAQQRHLPSHADTEFDHPFTDEGLLLIEGPSGPRFAIDAAWQWERFRPLVHPSLGDFLRILATDRPQGLAETFPQLHRLEFWADHHPHSPLLEPLSVSYRHHLADILLQASALWSSGTGADRQPLFDGMQAFPGLDANRVICRFLDEYLATAETGDDADDVVANLTDTIRYHPRPIELISPTE